MASTQWQELEALLQSVQSQRGVRGVVVILAVTGQALCDTFDADDREMATKTAAMALPLLAPTLEIAKACGDDEVEHLRVRSDKMEVVIMPRGRYVLCALQRQDSY